MPLAPISPAVGEPSQVAPQATIPTPGSEALPDDAPVLTFIDREALAEPSTAIQASAPQSAVYPHFDEAAGELPDQTGIQRLVIPDLQVDSRVIPKPFTGETWDISGLQTDVAWLGNTSHPDAGGNTVLAGHIMVRNIGRGPFRFLDQLSPGAKVIVYTQAKVYTYQVREQVTIKVTDSSVVADTGNPQLTLLTCSNWDENSESYVRRRAVFADLVSINPFIPNEPHEGDGIR